jgi:hypothetical protein
MNDLQHGNIYSRSWRLVLLLPSMLVSCCSFSCASLLQMADKGRLSVELIKTVLFFTETRSAVVTQRRFHAHFQCNGRCHSKQFINFKTSLMMMVQYWRGKVTGLHLCILWRTLTHSEVLQRSTSK